MKSKLESEKENLEQLILVETEYTCTLLDIFKVNYNDLSYIMFDGDTGLNGIVHDHDCSCHKITETDFGF